ncbi:MAG: hypothetical protein QOE23_2792, partial [Pseudonocardiales bacterium]|nr:hypothetical protein [Pseudonocardiales bacterium]
MRPRRSRLRDAVVLIVTASLVLNFESPASTASPQSPSLPPAGSVTYSYDASGRLVGASEPGVGSVTHSYDAAGNLTATTPSTGADPQLTSVTPQHAPPGSIVTLRGANFSSTASDDQVSFGGTAATVGSAAAGSLTVTVPAAATSGPVSVTVGGVTATGPSFTVEPSAQAPTITGFSASQVNLGATLTVSGSHFDPNPARNVVQINQTRAPVTTASATSLTVTVPPAAAGSGKVTVSTPAGVATSAADLYVLPAALAANTFDAGQRITPSATVTLATAGPGHVALAVFDAPANGRLFVREGTSSVPSCNGTLTVYDPHGVSIGSDSCVWTKDYLDDLPLRTAGTYTVALSTNGSGGSVPVTLDLVPPDSTAAISTDGTPTTITTSVGQSAKLSFSGTANQRIFVKITGNTAEASSCAALTLQGPAGTVTTGSACSASSYIDTTTLPSDGGYSLTFNPGGTDAGSATIAIYTVPADSIIPVSADGTPTTVTTSIGQSANLTFSGTANQRVFVKVTGNTAEATSCVALALVNPSGSNVVTGSGCSASSYLDTTTLPSDGTYTFRFNPGGTDAGSATIAIYTVPADSIIPVSADGTPTTITTSIGQNGKLTFSGSTGQRIFVNITNSTARSSSCPVFTLLSPSGSTVVSKTSCSASDYLDTTSLPADGSYSLTF